MVVQYVKKRNPFRDLCLKSTWGLENQQAPDSTELASQRMAPKAIVSEE